MTDLRDFSFAQPSLAESRMKWAQGAHVRGALFSLLMGAGFIAFGIYDPRFKLTLGLGILFAGFGLYNFFRSKFRAEPRQFRLCAHCGYNITGNTTGKCPECGKFC